MEGLLQARLLLAEILKGNVLGVLGKELVVLDEDGVGIVDEGSGGWFCDGTFTYWVHEHNVVDVRRGFATQVVER